jgi:hypothetical protein
VPGVALAGRANLKPQAHRFCRLEEEVFLAPTFLILDRILAAVAAKLFADFHAEIYSAEGAK